MAELNLNLQKKQNFARVWFANRGMSKLIKSSDSLPNATPNSSAIVHIADILKDAQFEPQAPDFFQSLPELEGLEYVGYIIEKERLESATGQWIRVEEYRIVGSEATGFKDSRVAYNNFYRYRIRSVVKITLKEYNSTLTNYEILSDIRRVQTDELKQELRNKEEILANINRITNVSVLRKTSDGETKQIFDLLPKVQIQADQHSTEMVKISSDAARQNFKQLRLRKNAQLSDSTILDGTITAQQLQKIINDQLKNFQEHIEQYVSFYYKSASSTQWRYVGVYESIPPPPPSSIRIDPSTSQGYVCITWLKPANNQRDIEQFRLYRRSFIGEQWLFLGSFTGSENLYIDRDVEVGVPYIYALTSVDVHNIESVLSTQIQAQLNPKFIFEKQERPLRWVSGSGAMLSELNTIYKKFQERPIPIVAKKNVVIGPKKEYNDTERKLVVRVKSLDTHENKEFVIFLRNENIRKGETKL